MRSNEVGIADAEIYPGRDICKILHSCHCVRNTVLNLQVLKVYAYKPVKNFAFKNYSLNSLSCVRTLIHKTVQISVCRTSILLVFQTKKECRLILLDLILHSFNLFIHFVSIADFSELFQANIGLFCPPIN